VVQKVSPCTEVSVNRIKTCHRSYSILR